MANIGSYAQVTIVDQDGNPVGVTAGALDTTGGGGGGLATVNLTQVGGLAIALGQDTSGTGANSLPVVLASGTSIAITGAVTASGSVALLAGSALIGKVGIDQTTPGTTNGVQINAALPAGTALIGKVGIDQTTNGTTNGVVALPATAGGLAISSTIIPNNTTAIVPKAGAGQLYAIAAYNNSAVIAYIKIYNATSATAGSGTPVSRHMIPAPAAGGGGGIIFSNDIGIAFSTGITYVITTGIADNDTGAPAANNYIVNFYYK